MPGVAIRISSANFSRYVDREVPHLAQATGYWLFGGDADTSRVNLAPNAPVAEGAFVGAAAGDITFGAGYANLTPEASFNSGITPIAADPFTYIAICRPSSRQVLCGTWHSGILGHMLYRTNTDFLAHSTAGGSAFTHPTKPAFTATQFFAVTRSASGRVLYFHDGTTLQSLAAAAVPGGAVNSYQVGPRGGTGNQADLTPHRHVANMLFPVALSQAAIEELYDYFAFKLPSRGINL